MAEEPGQPVIGHFSASDGYRFGYRKFATPGVPCGRVVMIHGIQSHGGWYLRSCAILAKEGYEVYFLDRRGSGMNTEARGDAPSFRRLLDDIGEFTRALPNDGLKKFLVAISWGGKLAVGTQYRSPGLFDGMALICPGLVANVRPGFSTRMGITFSKFLRPRKMYPIPLNDPALFTTSESWREFLRNDPLALREGTARLLSSSVLLDIYNRRAKKRVTLPTLLMLAGNDKIINNDRVRAIFDRFPARDKTVREYVGSEHTLEFEPEGHPFVGDLLGWMLHIQAA